MRSLPTPGLEWSAKTPYDRRPGSFTNTSPHTWHTHTTVRSIFMTSLEPQRTAPVLPSEPVRVNLPVQDHGSIKTEQSHNYHSVKETN